MPGQIVGERADGFAHAVRGNGLLALDEIRLRSLISFSSSSAGGIQGRFPVWQSVGTIDPSPGELFTDRANFDVSPCTRSGLPANAAASTAVRWRATYT